MARDDVRGDRSVLLGWRRSDGATRAAAPLSGSTEVSLVFLAGAPETTWQKIMKECVSGKTSVKEDEGALHTYKEPPERSRRCVFVLFQAIRLFLGALRSPPEGQTVII